MIMTLQNRVYSRKEHKTLFTIWRLVNFDGFLLVPEKCLIKEIDSSNLVPVDCQMLLERTTKEAIGRKNPSKKQYINDQEE